MISADEYTGMNPDFGGSVNNSAHTNAGAIGTDRRSRAALANRRCDALRMQACGTGTLTHKRVGLGGGLGNESCIRLAAESLRFASEVAEGMLAC